ncbi:MAG: carboxypeptidase regulatory-like domain-containing protein, partial [Thermoplasmata archaeon]|nr:carboxypeptidase regulatory-like domain-containing protein [Thermoplasmata archaeon]
IVVHATLNSPGAYGLKLILNYGAIYIGETDGLIGDIYSAIGDVNITVSIDVGSVGKIGYNSSFQVITETYEYRLGSWNMINSRGFITVTVYSSDYFSYKLSWPALSGTPEIEAIDDDSDGEYELLQVSLNFTGGVDAFYDIYARLRENSTGQTVGQDRGGLHISPGNLTQVTLSFPGWSIFQSGRNSPYQVLFDIYEQYSSHYYYSVQDIYITDSYLSTQFDSSWPAVLSVEDDYGIDIDGDGKYDLLTVEVSVNFNGSATLLASLRNGSAIAGYDVWRSVSTGNQRTALFYFNGKSIRNLNMHSPYDLTIEYSDGRGNAVNLPTLTVSTAYSPDMFERSDLTLLTGIILDGSTGSPVSGATVSGEGNSTTTSINGTFSMNVESGVVPLSLSKSGYNSRTAIIEAKGASKSVLLLLFQPAVEDSMIKGFLKDKKGVAAKAQSYLVVLYVDMFYVKTVQIGPKGYFEIPVKSGIVIVQFGLYQNYYGSFKVAVQPASTVWSNYTAQYSTEWVEEWEYALTDYDNGWLRQEYKEKEFDALTAALVADFLCGDSNGVVTEDELRIIELMTADSNLPNFYDSSEDFLVDEELYLYDLSTRTLKIDGLKGPLEYIYQSTRIVTAKLESRSTIPDSASHTISAIYRYDVDAPTDVEKYRYTIILPLSSNVTGTDAPDDVSITGTNPIILDPQTANVPNTWIGHARMFISTNTTATTGNIQGRITLQDSSENAGILVRVLDSYFSQIKSVYTISGGEYFAGGISPGKYFVQAVNFGYYSSGSAVSLAAGKNTFVNITLYPSSTSGFFGNLTGRVLSEAGNPISNAVVTITYLSNSTILASILTDAEGVFLVSMVKPGAVEIISNVEGYLTSRSIGYINGFKTEDIGDILMYYPTGKIIGKIVDDEGTPRGGVTVNLYDSNGDLVKTILTDANGNFELIQLFDGVYDIYFVWNDREIGNRTNISVADGGSVDIGTVEIPASAFAVSQDYLIWIIVAAAVAAAALLGIWWRMKQPGLPRKEKVLRPEEGMIVSEEEEQAEIEEEMEEETRSRRPRRY